MLLASWFLDCGANKEFTTSCFTLDLGTDGSGFKTAIVECQNTSAQPRSGYSTPLFKVVRQCTHTLYYCNIVTVFNNLTNMMLHANNISNISYNEAITIYKLLSNQFFF